MASRKVTDWIIIHCSATPPGKNIRASKIKELHTSPRSTMVEWWPKPLRGKAWSDIGYHYVICRDGLLERGRPEHRVGAHCKGRNSTSIGVCLVGGITKAGKPANNFTKAQWAALERLLTDVLLPRFPKAGIIGHRDFDPYKACPCFDAGAWWNGVLAAREEKRLKEKEELRKAKEAEVEPAE